MESKKNDNRFATTTNKCVQPFVGARNCSSVIIHMRKSLERETRFNACGKLFNRSVVRVFRWVISTLKKVAGKCITEDRRKYILIYFFLKIFKIRKNIYEILPKSLGLLRWRTIFHFYLTEFDFLQILLRHYYFIMLSKSLLMDAVLCVGRHRWIWIAIIE